MVWRAIFLTFVAGVYCVANSGCGQKSPGTSESETSVEQVGTRKPQTPEFLPATAYVTMTVRPAELLQQPAVRKLYDHLAKTVQDDADRELMKRRGFNQGRWIFPGGQHSEFLNLDSYTLHTVARTSPNGEVLRPSEGRVYRYKNEGEFKRALNYAKQDYKPATVPAFSKQVYQQEMGSLTMEHEKPYVSSVSKAMIEEDVDLPDVKGEDPRPRKPKPPRRDPQEILDRQPIPADERWKYTNTLSTEGERTLLYSFHGLTVQQMLDAKNAPAWSAEYAKFAGYPLSAAIDLRQVREYAKHLISFRYLSGLHPEMQQTVKELIEQIDLAFVAVDTADGLKVMGRLEASDEAAAKKAVTLLEKMRGKTAGLALPFMFEANRLIPGGGTLLDKELQAVLDGLAITQDGKTISLDLTIPAAAWEAAVKKALAALVQTERELQGIRWLSEALREHLRYKRTFPVTTMSPGGQLVSWRVHLLPFIGEKALYEKYKQDEPWDSEANLKVLEQMPNMYRAPGSDPKSNTTCYVLPVHPKAMCREIPTKGGLGEHRVSDGTSKTIAILETETQIPWTKPDDLVIDDNKPLLELGFKSQPMARVIMASGEVRVIRKNVPLAILLPWLTPNGGEQLMELQVE